MLRIVKAALTLIALVVIYQATAGADGAPMPSGGGGARPMSPEEMAAQAHNSGMNHRDRGVKAELDAAKDKKESDRLKNQKKAREEYEKALSDFKKAAELNPRLAPAFNGMGYSYRKLGDYTKALENYDHALKLSPNFTDAIEYRGEAYLGLNRIDEAKQAYLALFAADRKQADMLMKAMTDYVARKKADPAGVDPAALSAFETWIKERSEMSAQTVAMALNRPHVAWQ